MGFIEIPYDTPIYAAALELRHNILRRPLGLDLYAEDLTLEQHEWHYGFEEQGQLVATVTLRPDKPGRVLLRQMAVAGDCQGRGLGRRLIELVEQSVRERGIGEIHLHARCEAEGFYQRLGYKRVGEEFLQVGIWHVEMNKRLDRG